MPLRFTISGEVDAGDQGPQTVGAFETVRIGTGAAVPSVFDAVIPAELVTESEGTIVVSSGVEKGQSIRLRGEDIRAGRIALTARTRIRPQEIGLLAALGFDPVPIIPAPRVSVVSVGPEIFPDALPAPIQDVNGPMLAAQIAAGGGQVGEVAKCTGEAGSLGAVLARLSRQSDLIITSGGVSDGAADTMGAVLSSTTTGELWSVRLKPGKHFGIAQIGGCLVLSLPGNPVAAFVGFELFGRLAIDVLAGRSPETNKAFARSSAPLDSTFGRTDVLRGNASVDSAGQLWATPTTNRGSGIVSSLLEANCLIVMPEATAHVLRDEVVEIRWVGYQ